MSFGVEGITWVVPVGKVFTAVRYAGVELKIFTSSRGLMASRTYTIFDAEGKLVKFGVTDAEFFRMNQSLQAAGEGSYARWSSIMTKSDAHLSEKYLRSLHYNSTGEYFLNSMKIPYPVSFETGLKIKPPL